MGKFLGVVKPIEVKLVTATAKTLEERCRTKMLRNIHDQLKLLKSPKAKGRRWFKTIGDQIVFIPRYANESLATKLSGGKGNAYPLIRTPLKTLKALAADVEAGELDNVLVQIAQTRGRALAGKRQKKAA